MGSTLARIIELVLLIGGILAFGYLAWWLGDHNAYERGRADGWRLREQMYRNEREAKLRPGEYDPYSPHPNPGE